jgi:hypothetical protein
LSDVSKGLVDRDHRGIGPAGLGSIQYFTDLASDVVLLYTSTFHGVAELASLLECMGAAIGDEMPASDHVVVDLPRSTSARPDEVQMLTRCEPLAFEYRRIGAGERTAHRFAALARPLFSSEKSSFS